MNVASLRPGPLLDNFQMLPFAINDPHITGYSVCWASRLFRLHAHREGEDMSFYRDLDASYDQPTWIYMPTDPGELITDIWFRQSEGYSDLALVVSA